MWRLATDPPPLSPLTAHVMPSYLECTVKFWAKIFTEAEKHIRG